MVTIQLIFLIALLVIFFIWISSFFFGAPFQPTSNKALKIMTEFSGINSIKSREKEKKIKIADLGSGNGKIVIAFAKLCKNLGLAAEVHGFEINPLLVWASRARIKKLGLEDMAFVHRKNFWKQNFSDFSMITSFQISYVMPELEKKLMKELHKDSKIISDTWKFPNWKPKKEKSYGMGNVFLYIKE